MNMYGPTDTSKFIDVMCAKGWEPIQLNEGGVGIGDWVLIAPDDDHYNFVIREVYLNEWSSAQTVRRCSKLSKKLLKEIDMAEVA